MLSSSYTGLETGWWPLTITSYWGKLFILWPVDELLLGDAGNHYEIHCKILSHPNSNYRSLGKIFINLCCKWLLQVAVSYKIKLFAKRYMVLHQKTCYDCYNITMVAHCLHEICMSAYTCQSVGYLYLIGGRMDGWKKSRMFELCQFFFRFYFRLVVSKSLETNRCLPCKQFHLVIASNPRQPLANWIAIIHVFPCWMEGAECLPTKL